MALFKSSSREMIFLQKSHLTSRLISYAACILFSYSLFLAAQPVASSHSHAGIYRVHDTFRANPSSSHSDVAPPKPDDDDVTSTSFQRKQQQSQQTLPQEPPVNPSKIWAVLVAGSNGFYNYRHQVRTPFMHLI